MADKRIKDIDFQALTTSRTYHPSPSAWEDQVLYFMMVDRFSDGRENRYRDNNNQLVTTGTTPLFQATDNGNAIMTPNDAAKWRQAGTTWVGGILKGLESKLGYLKRLGVTAIWVSPIFKQVRVRNTYHGYGTQDFLDVDPKFGTRDDLKSMVAMAHRLGLYVILDIILNHSGDVFSYDSDRYWTEDPTTHTWYLDPRWDGRHYLVRGYRDGTGSPSLPFTPVDLARHPAGGRMAPSGPLSCKTRPRLRRRAALVTGTTTPNSSRATSVISRISILVKPQLVRQATTESSSTNHQRHSMRCATSISSGSHLPISTAFEWIPSNIWISARCVISPQ